MLLTRLCLVMYATPRMLKLLLFCLWPSRIVVPFDRSILIVLKIGLFVPQGTLPSRRVAGFKDLWYPAFFLLFVIVSNACHVHL